MKRVGNSRNLIYGDPSMLRTLVSDVLLAETPHYAVSPREN